MPTYTYRCRTCNHRFERVMTLREHEKKARPPCPKCGASRAVQVPSQVRVVTASKA